MKKFIKNYINENESRFNFGIINREYDESLVTYIINCCKSLEVLEYVQFLGYEYIENESEINTSDYILARKRGTKKSSKKKEKYTNLHDSRHAELRLRFRLDCKGETEHITKRLLIPIPDEDGYFTIKGTKYYLMYQIVDNSTYTTKHTITLKSMMPVSIKMNKESYDDTNGNTYEAPVYKIAMFKKDVDILIYYFAKIGASNTLKYFSVGDIIEFSTTMDNSDLENLYFGIGSKLFLKVNKHFFDKYRYVKTITFMILNICTNRLSFDDVDNKDYWIDKIGALSSINPNAYHEKGLGTLTFFDRIIDDTTKSILKIHPIHKKNIYSILRWMIQNFDQLRKKDNLDLNNKRLRCNEYIAALLTMELSTRVNRIITLGNKVTMNRVKEIFKFPGDIIIQKLYSSGLLRFDDRVNDLDFYSKLKFTFKGPNSLGGKNENNISIKYRGIDPSYIGKIDINVCGTSDPGTSGVLTPFCKTDGLYFNNENEPEGFMYTFDKDINDSLKKKDNGNILVEPKFDSTKNYFDYCLHSKDVISEIKARNKKKRDKNHLVIDIRMPDDDDI